MIAKTLSLLAGLIFCIATSAQTTRKSIISGYTGIGAYSTNHTDVFSFTANQASLARLKRSAAGVFAERRFLLKELNNYSAVAGITTSSGNFGLKTNYFGFSDYNETLLGLAYARQLGDKADIGIQFNYNSIMLAGYGNASAISFEAGTIFHLTDKISAGIHVNNPVGGKFGNDKEEKLPSVYTLGAGYEASDKLLISAELVKEENQPLNVNAGIQYKFIPQLQARAGISSATASWWSGIGLSWKLFRLDVTAAYHPQLGITPGLMLIINFKAVEN